MPSGSPTFLPWNNGYPVADPQLPFHDTLEDPADPGRMKPEWTADGDHPSVEGYRRPGEIAFRVPASQ